MSLFDFVFGKPAKETKVRADRKQSFQTVKRRVKYGPGQEGETDGIEVYNRSTDIVFITIERAFTRKAEK